MANYNYNHGVVGALSTWYERHVTHITQRHAKGLSSHRGQKIMLQTSAARKQILLQKGANAT